MTLNGVGSRSILQNKMVSILVPVYNTSQYLRECVASLSGQTYTDLQIVLINDGSTDDSWDVMQELAQQDKRLEIYSQPNCGVAATRNRLLDKARGDFVLYVDSDDWIERDTIEILMNEQQKEDYDIVMFQLSTPQPHDYRYTREEAVNKFLEHVTFRGSLCDKLIKRELFEGLSIDETVSYGEDALLVWQVLQRISIMLVIGKVLYHYRVNESSLSRCQFNGKKFSAYTSWDSICLDAKEFWPQYSDIARARFACEMAQILRAAAINGYPRTSSVKLLQEEIRHDSHLIKKTGISSTKMSVFAWLSSHCYWLVRRLSRFI